MSQTVSHGIVFTIIAVIIGASILIGNSIVIFLFMTVDNLKSTSRYFYVSLALADFTAGLVIIASFKTTYVGYWPYSHELCMICGYWTSLSLSLSMWSLTALTVDRYLAICHSLKYNSWVTTNRVRYVCGVMWLIGIIIWFVPFTVTNGFTYLPRNMICGLNITNLDITATYTFFVFVPFASTIIFCYTKIIRAIKNFVVPSGTSESVKQRHLQNRKAIKTIGITVAAFFIAWTPFLIAVVVEKEMEKLPSSLSFALNWIAFSNSFWNVIIYTITNKNFRGNMRTKFKRFSVSSVSSGE